MKVFVQGGDESMLVLSQSDANTAVFELPAIKTKGSIAGATDLPDVEIRAGLDGVVNIFDTRS